MLCEVNGLPKLNTITKTDLINLSIILYCFSSNNHQYKVYFFISIAPKSTEKLYTVPFNETSLGSLIEKSLNTLPKQH